MRNRLLYIFLLILLSVADASAQTDTIRYVNAKTGKYANDGKKWDTAKDNVQDAINDLYDYMQRNNLHSGSVYVAAGTYTPSESTSDSASVLSTSFKIYDGIHVYGGFNADDRNLPPTSVGSPPKLHGATGTWARRMTLLLKMQSHLLRICPSVTWRRKKRRMVMVSCATTSSMPPFSPATTTP